MYLYCRHAYLIFTLLKSLSQFTNICDMCAELLFTVLKLCKMHLEESEPGMKVVPFEVLSVVVHKILSRNVCNIVHVNPIYFKV
jgi:hypothetical protein